MISKEQQRINTNGNRETTSIIDMAYALDLVPVQTDNLARKVLVLGNTGNGVMFSLTFRMLKYVYAQYLSGSIDEKYMLSY